MIEDGGQCEMAMLVRARGEVRVHVCCVRFTVPVDFVAHEGRGQAPADREQAHQQEQQPDAK
jgi:hypothetical protein